MSPFSRIQIPYRWYLLASKTRTSTTRTVTGETSLESDAADSFYHSATARPHMRSCCLFRPPSLPHRCLGPCMDRLENGDIQRGRTVTDTALLLLPTALRGVHCVYELVCFSHRANRCRDNAERAVVSRTL